MTAKATTHFWYVGGTNSRYVMHTSAEDKTGSDALGVGVGEDVMYAGSAKAAQKFADALNNAYRAGALAEFWHLADREEYPHDPAQPPREN
jgi:hypothetical protein